MSRRQRVKQLWVERILGWFDEWLAAGQPGQAWPRMETTNREIKFVLLDEIAQRGETRYKPVLRAWKARETINTTLQALEQPML